MKIQVVKNDTMMQMNPMDISRIRFSLGVRGSWVLSRITKPKAPMVNRKEDASPSMIYWPLTL